MRRSSLLGVEDGVAALQVFFLEHRVDVIVKDSADERVNIRRGKPVSLEEIESVIDDLLVKVLATIDPALTVKAADDHTEEDELGGLQVDLDEVVPVFGMMNCRRSLGVFVSAVWMRPEAKCAHRSEPSKKAAMLLA